MLVHIVLFYFKGEATEADIAKAKEMAEGLSRIETVKGLCIGSPASVTQRPACVSDYDLCLTVLFDSVEDHNTYQDHPLHIEYLETNKRFWEKVVVYDAD